MMASMHFGPGVALTTLPGFAEMMVTSFRSSWPCSASVPTRMRHGTARRADLLATRTAAGDRGQAIVCSRAPPPSSPSRRRLTVAIVSGALLVADVTDQRPVAAARVLVAKAIDICALWAAIGLGWA